MNESTEIVSNKRKEVKQLPPTELLKEFFDYNPDTGALLWRKRDIKHFTSANSHAVWNSRFAGKNAGSERWSNGLKRNIGVNLHPGAKNCMFYAHRIIFALMGVPVPEFHVIDHISGDPFDNRWCNLRIANDQQSAHNRKRRSDNTSLYKGVSRHLGKFWARIQIGGKRKSLGVYDTAEAAYEAYCKAAKELHGAFSRLE
jgi:hypothetical protein